jgi:hypothetical protein
MHQQPLDGKVQPLALNTNPAVKLGSHTCLPSWHCMARQDGRIKTHIKPSAGTLTGHAAHMLCMLRAVRENAALRGAGRGPLSASLLPLTRLAGPLSGLAGPLSATDKASRPLSASLLPGRRCQAGPVTRPVRGGSRGMGGASCNLPAPGGGTPPHEGAPLPRKGFACPAAAGGGRGQGFGAFAAGFGF